MFQEDLRSRNTRYCSYLRALGELGLGETEKASSLMDEARRSPAEEPDLDFSPPAELL